MEFEGRCFTAKQVVKVTRVSYETLNHWAKIGLVKPSISPARGSGSRRLYDFQDLVAIRVAQKLRRAGIFGKALVGILKVMREAGFDSPAEVAIDVTPGGDAVVTSRAGESFSARRRPGQLFFDFNCDCRLAAAEVREVLRTEESDFAESNKVTRKAKSAVEPPVGKRNPAARRSA